MNGVQGIKCKTTVTIDALVEPKVRRTLHVLIVNASNNVLCYNTIFIELSAVELSNQLVWQCIRRPRAVIIVYIKLRSPETTLVDYFAIK